MVWLILFWVVCGVLAYGITFATEQEEFPNLAESWRERDKAFSLCIGILGPLGLAAISIVNLLDGYKVIRPLKFK